MRQLNIRIQSASVKMKISHFIEGCVEERNNLKYLMSNLQDGTNDRRICCICFAAFIKFLLTQQLSDFFKGAQGYCGY